MFAFGKNWLSFSRSKLTLERIESARKDFHALVQGIQFSGRSFVDIGFGQGLSLFFAQELGATVHGIDVDPVNQEALRETAKRFPGNPLPNTQVASILDASWVEAHEQHFDIVHSWGVLHHTGHMKEAIANAIRLLRKSDSTLILSIYNKHWSSPIWRVIKAAFNNSPRLIQRSMIATFFPIIAIAKFLVTFKNPFQKDRGMDFYHDVVDWVGGYPYEYLSFEELKNILREQGLIEFRTIPAEVPTGCNQIVAKFVL